MNTHQGKNKSRVKKVYIAFQDDLSDEIIPVKNEIKTDISLPFTEIQFLSRPALLQESKQEGADIYTYQISIAINRDRLEITNSLEKYLDRYLLILVIDENETTRLIGDNDQKAMLTYTRSTDPNMYNISINARLRNTAPYYDRTILKTP